MLLPVVELRALSMSFHVSTTALLDTQRRVTNGGTRIYFFGSGVQCKAFGIVQPRTVKDLSAPPAGSTELKILGNVKVFAAVAWRPRRS